MMHTNFDYFELHCWAQPLIILMKGFGQIGLSFWKIGVKWGGLTTRYSFQILINLNNACELVIWSSTPAYWSKDYGFDSTLKLFILKQILHFFPLFLVEPDFFSFELFDIFLKNKILVYKLNGNKQNKTKIQPIILQPTIYFPSYFIVSSKIIVGRK